MTKLRLALASFVLVAFAAVAVAQQGFWPNWPIVGGASYSCGTTNGVQTCTVPAGPTIVTGNEQVPANTELSQGRSPQNVLLPLASLNALPYTFTDYTGGTTGPSAAAISASNVTGGAYFISGSTITVANVTLPLAPIYGQEFVIGSSVTLTALKVSVHPSSTATISNAPTVLTISTTGTYGYKFRYYGTGNKWYRIY